MHFNFATYTKISNNLISFITNKTENDNIIQWISKTTMKLLSQLPEGNMTNYLTPDFDLQENFKLEIEHIKDFLEHLPENELLKQLKGNYQQVNTNAKKWSLLTQKQGEKLRTKAEEGLQILMSFKDGYKIVRLMTKEHCTREGNIMGHCIGGYNPTTKQLLSLRDANNIPHVSIEADLKNRIKQIKGKANTQPLSEYQKYIRYFLRKNPNYKIGDDGENIGYLKWGKTYYDPESDKWDKIYNEKIIPLQQRRFEEIKDKYMERIEIIDLSNLFLRELPDFISDVHVDSFYCNNNQLTSLQGAPKSVDGGFHCYDNQLTSLQGAPGSVGGNFYCTDNQLTSLQGAPKSVDGGFYCYNNQLTSLQGAPESVGRSFDCNNNQLTSLQGAPKSVGGSFDCNSNQLTSLQGAPKSVRGDFYCNNNQLTSLQGAPKSVRGDFYCNNNQVKFTEEQVRAVCNVRGIIYV